MPIIRVEKIENYSVVNNHFINDETLSWKAKGILVYLLSRPNDWQIYIEHLKTCSTDGKDSTASGIQELIKSGYIKRDLSHDDKGKLNGYNYVVYEYPSNKCVITHEYLPSTDNPSTDNPSTEKPSLLSTDSNKYLNNNIDDFGKEKKTSDSKNYHDAPPKVPPAPPLGKIYPDEVERIYKAYPGRCPVTKRSLGKSLKDKDLIMTALKSIPCSSLEKLILDYLTDCANKSVYMKNFSTFMRHLPDDFSEINSVNNPQKKIEKENIQHTTYYHYIKNNCPPEFWKQEAEKVKRTLFAYEYTELIADKEEYVEPEI